MFRVAGRCLGCGSLESLESREPGEECGKWSRRPHNQNRERIRSSPGLYEALSKVQQVTSRLNLASASEIGGIDAQAVERVSARDDGVVGQDAAEFEGEGIERAAEFVGGEQERSRKAGVVPSGCSLGAFLQVVTPQRLDDRHGSRPWRLDIDPVMMVWWTRRRGRVESERDERLQPCAEDIAEVSLQCRDLTLERASFTHCNHVSRHDAPVPIECSGCDFATSMSAASVVAQVCPSLLGGLKNNPWLDVNAVVTMFDSGGSSGQLRDELGVLPPGDILKCALALSRNAREARRVLLARLPTLEHARLGGHTGGNLLLSMMQRYSGDFLDAVDGLRALLGCRGRVWPVSVEQASVCAEYGDGSITRGEVEVDAGQSSGRLVRRIWLEPPVWIHPTVATAIGEFDAAIIGPGSFYTSLTPIFLVRGVPEAMAKMNGPVILIANLLTEGRGMAGFTAADAVARIEEAIGRRVDVVIVNEKWPSPQVLWPICARTQGTAGAGNPAVAL